MFKLERVESDWIKACGAAASLNSFGEVRPSELDRSQFGLVFYNDEHPVGYVTCIEMDAETLYWQIGGGFSDSQKTWVLVPCYLAMIDWSLARYQRIMTRIENSNISMLHMAMKMGFRVVGTWNFKDKIYLELLNEREMSDARN